MEIIFRAHDGTEFRDAIACQVYEEYNPMYKMWDNCGETKCHDSALIVKIGTGANALNKFLDDCREADITAEGIEGAGVYMWSHELFEWVLIDASVLNAIEHFLK